VSSRDGGSWLRKEIRNCFVRRHRIEIQTHVFLPAFPSCNLMMPALLAPSACSTSISSRRICFKISVSYVDTFLFWLNSDNNSVKSYMLICMSARVPSIALLICRINVWNTGLVQNFNAQINKELCTWIAVELTRENIQWILRREVVGTGLGSCRVAGSGISGSFSATLFF